MSLTLLTAAIMAVSSTGRPDGVRARTMARAFMTCAEDLDRPDVDAWLIAATAWHESGFRPGAVNASGPHRMVGLLQLNERYLPVGFMWRDVGVNTREFCAKLKRVARHHDKHCDPMDHHVLAHHFSGFRVTPRAKEAAREVLLRRETLKEIAKRPRPRA